MIRAALAVVLAAALLSASLPAIDDARRDRTAARMERAAERVAAAATGLREDDPARRRGLAPRRTVSVRLPAQSWITGGVAWFRVADDAVSYALPGSGRVVHRVDAPIRTRRGPILLRDPGTHPLRLTLVRRRGTVLVLAERG